MRLFASRLASVLYVAALAAPISIVGCSSDSGDDDSAKGGEGGGGDGEGGQAGGDEGGAGGTSNEGGMAGGEAGGAGGGDEGGMGGGDAGGTGGGTGGSGGTAMAGMGGGGMGGMPNNQNPIEGIAAPAVITGRMGFDSEGPLWVASGNYLLFSDVNGEKIFKVEPQKPEGMRFTEWPYKNGVKTNGLAIDKEGNLYVCERSTGLVTKLKLPDGQPTTIAGSPMRMNAPNDIIVSSQGIVYFTDPGWGAPMPKPRDNNAYRIDKQGMLHVVTTGNPKPTSPNGIALSPDEKTLYVGDDLGNKVLKYTVNADGSTGAGSMFIDGTIENVTTPDGIAVDDAGNVYVTSNGKKLIGVFKPDGSKIGEIKNFAGGTSNASFGGPDRKTLYVTTGGSISSVVLKVPGIP